MNKSAFDLPAAFFADLEDTKPTRNTFGDIHGNWTPSACMMWYDGIIDDILTHPGTRINEVAKRLGRSPSTISTIINSDLFKARWAQRREAFSAALDEKIRDKMFKVADLALDSTLAVLEKKRDAVPLPLLNDIAKTTLDRLGYFPSAPHPGASVNINLNPPVHQTVTAEGLARAREHLLRSERIIEAVVGPVPVVNRHEATVRKTNESESELNAGENGNTSPSPPAAGQEVETEEED
jgi:hypothetical protein